jgi:hypothetical protein
MKVAVIQSNYIPWKGYFDIMHDVDTFIFYDHVQFTKNDWRNRNKVKTAQGSVWLTIPTGTNLNRLICEVRLEEPRWQSKHYKTICQNYGKAPYFPKYQAFLEHVYLERKWETLSELNHYMIMTIARNFLGITTKFRDSREFPLEGARHDRLMDLLKKAGADCYYSGPSAKAYIEPSVFHDASIKLVYKDYSNYPEYRQPFPPFDHYVSVLDLLFNTGPDAPWYIWGWREEIPESRSP